MAFLIPYSASSTGTGGKTGIFVIPSNNLTAAPVFITTAANAAQAAISYNGTVSGNRIVSESPARLLFTATGSDGNIHMYGLDLTNLASTTPVQVGSLSLTNDNQLCNDSSGAETNLYQPSTLFVLTHVNPTSTSTVNNCGNGGDVYEVINYTDSPTTAPVVVSVTNTDIDPLYHSTGLLAGMVLFQGSNLDFFTTPAFASPTVLVPNVSVASNLADTTSAGEDFAGDGVAFYSIQDTTSVTKLYRISAAGTATSIYTASSTGTLDSDVSNDNANVFFTDVDSTAYRILAAPINSGNATLLYTADPSQGSYELIGSNGTLLAYQQNVSGGDATVHTISATSPTTTPALIATVAGSGINAFLAEATPGSLSSSQILINSSVPTTAAKSTEAITFTGSVTQALLANSEFEAFSGEAFFNAVFQIRGITDAGVGTFEGGGSVNLYTVGSASVVPLTLSGGAAYTVPAGSLIALGIIAGNSSDAVAVGIATASGGSNIGIAADSASHLIVPLSFSNTSIGPF